MSKKLIIVILLTFSFMFIKGVNINAAEPEYTWSLNTLSSGRPVAILNIDRPITENIVSVDLINYMYAYESIPDNIESRISLWYFDSGLGYEAIAAEFTLAEFQAYTNMLSLQIQGVYTIDIQQIYDDGYFVSGVIPDDILSVNFRLIHDPAVIYSEAETYLEWAKSDTLILFGESINIIYFRNFDNTLLLELSGSEFLPDFEPEMSDYPTPPNSFTRYVFQGWTYVNGLPVNESLPLNYDYAYNGYLTLLADYKLINAITGEIEDVTPETEGRIPNLFASLKLNTWTGYVIAYMLVVLVIITFSIKFQLNNIAVLVFIIAVTGVFNFFGFLPLLVSILIYLSLSVILIFNLRGSSI